MTNNRQRLERLEALLPAVSADDEALADYASLLYALLGVGLPDSVTTARGGFEYLMAAVASQPDQPERRTTPPGEVLTNERE